MAEKILYGQAWIDGNKLVQDITRVTDNGCFDEVSVLVEDIWDDLTSATGTYKYNNKKDYFYWEYNLTPIDNDDVVLKAMFSCPVPRHNLFEELDETKVNGEYSKYWVKKLKTSMENAEKAQLVQRKEIYLDGCQYVDQTGTARNIPSMYVNNDNLGDISNILGLF